MASLNLIILIGNLGSDPELRFTPEGKPVSNFSLAVNRSYKTPEGEKREEAEWFTVVAWNRLAENCNQFLSKGKRAYVEGRLRSRSWEKDGVKHFKNEVIAGKVVFLDPKREGDDLTPQAAAEREQVEELPD